MKLAVIVPCRDRAEHLKLFIPAISKQLDEEEIIFDIHVVEQSENGYFNKGKACNAGFALASEYDWYCFHDIDIIPLINGDYSQPKNPTALHALSSKGSFEHNPSINLGGACLFLPQHFREINGFSNGYWGWGCEDNDLTWRCQAKGLNIDKRTIVYQHMKDSSSRNMAYYKENCDYLTSQYDYDTDGLTTLNFELLESRKLPDHIHHLVELGSQ